MLSELAFPHIRCCLSAIPSDLMKSTSVDESLSSMNQQFCSRENQLLQSSPFPSVVSDSKNSDEDERFTDSLTSHTTADDSS